MGAEGELSQAAPWGRGSTNLGCFGVGCLEGVRSGERRGQGGPCEVWVVGHLPPSAAGVGSALTVGEPGLGPQAV